MDNLKINLAAPPPTPQTPLNEIPEKFVKKMNEGDFTLSYSSFSSFVKSPNLFAQYKLKQRKTTKAMLKGSVFHCLTLEPEEFHKEYILKTMDTPGGNMGKFAEEVVFGGKFLKEAYRSLYAAKTQKNEAKRIEAENLQLKGLLKKTADYRRFLKSIGEREVIDRASYENAYLMSQMIRRNPTSRTFIDAEGENEGFISFELGGFKWNGKVDKKITDERFRFGRCIFDLKQVPDASPREVKKKIKYDGWATQAALYSYGMPGFWERPYFMVCCDPKGQVSVVEVTREQRSEAMRSLGYYLNKFRACIVEEAWDASFEYFSKSPGGVF